MVKPPQVGAGNGGILATSKTIRAETNHLMHISSKDLAKIHDLVLEHSEPEIHKKEGWIILLQGLINETI